MEELSLNGFIQEMKDASSGAHQRKFCFVLGAGASKSSDIKTGEDLVRIWDAELKNRNPGAHEQWKKDNNITDENMSSHYSEYYERRFKRCPADGLNFIEKIMQHAVPSVGYVILSYILTHSEHNVVITTNFDHLTEYAINYYEHEMPLVIGHEALAKYIAENPKRPTIVKIHRDLLLDPKNKTADLKELSGNWKEALGRIFSNYHPIFIGYAGNDESLMDFLNENAVKFKDNTWKFPYWMIYEDNTPEEKVKTFLNNSNGYIIHHEGFDPVMLLIGKQFGYNLPSKEEFLENPKKRYRSLKDAFDKISDKISKDKIIKKPRNNSIMPEPENETSALQDESLPPEADSALNQIISESDSQKQFKEANELYSKGEYGKAAAILEELVNREPANIRYCNNLALALLQMKETDRALQVAKKAVAAAPENNEAYVLLAQIFEATGDTEKAFIELQRAAKLKSDSALPYYDMGNILLDLGKIDEALKAFQKVVEIEPHSAESYCNIGEILSKQGKTDEALKAYKKVTELNPDWALPYYAIGALFYDQGKTDEALKAYNKITELDPNWTLPYYFIGNILFDKGKTDEALKNYQKAYRLKPDWNEPKKRIEEILKNK